MVVEKKKEEEFNMGGKYIGPTQKLVRKYSDQVFSKKKVTEKRKRKTIVRRQKTEYGQLLMNQTKVCTLYNISKRQLYNYIEESINKCVKGSKDTKSKVNSGDILVQKLEMRLDNAVYRLGMGVTRKSCRNLVSYGHIMVNYSVVKCPSFQVKIGDVITYNDKDNCDIQSNNSMSSDICSKIYSWLKVDKYKDKYVYKIVSEPMKKDISENIDINGLIEIFSK